jgi:hypothetical protein
MGKGAGHYSEREANYRLLIIVCLMVDETRTDDSIVLKKIEFVEKTAHTQTQNTARRNDVRQYNSCYPFEG